MSSDTRKACVMMLLLLLASGCLSLPRALPSSSPLLSPIASVPATYPFATPTPPSTGMPFSMVVTSIPTLTPMPKPDTVKGWGSFPRMAAVADEALYLVQGDTATLLLDFRDITDKAIRFYETRTRVQLSPNGQYVAYLFDTDTGDDFLGYVDIQSGENYLLKVVGNLQTCVGSKGEQPFEDITSFAWMDNQRILYTKRKSAPDLAEPWLAELWLVALEDAEETKLASDKVLKVLGVSPDKEQVFFLYGTPFYDFYSKELAGLDLVSGAMTRLLPPEGAEQGLSKRYVSFTLVTMPDTTQRIVAAEINPWETVNLQKPVIWMVDPRNNSIDAIWTISQGRDIGTDYDFPVDFIWSPSSESKFVYSTYELVFDGVWMVDLKNDNVVQIVEISNTGGQILLLAWSFDGIVTQSFPGFDKLTLWSETGEIIGEIEF